MKLIPEKTYQPILGFGSSLEPTTCFNLSRLDPKTREETLARLVGEEGMGMNLMRISIGTPDFTGDPWYSYDDLPAGETDPEMKRFSIEKDRAYILPILKLAQRKNPKLLWIASPWSPPAWMKSTQSLIGGKLIAEHYPAYAKYFVKFLDAYAAEGILVHAVTVQNEPGVDRSKESPRWHYPSCRWTGAEERDFIRDHLGPALASRRQKTEIWCYDHNYNVEAKGDDPGIAYPRTILEDPKAAAFVRGVAFHGYAGQPDGMSVFHSEFPGTPLYFTEGSTYGVGGAARIIALLRNWAWGYNAWVTMIDPEGKPNNGPFRASKTCIMLNKAGTGVDYRFDFYMYGHFARYVRRDAVRIEVQEASPPIPVFAAKNPDGPIAVVIAQTSLRPRRVRFQWGERAVEPELPAQAVATLIFPPVEAPE